METFSTIVGILIVGLLLAAVVTIIKYPKDVIRGFFNLLKPNIDNIRSWIFFPIWIVGLLIEELFNFKIYDENSKILSEERYKSTRNRKFDFKGGKKYLLADVSSNVMENLVKGFLGFSYANLKVDDFKIEKSNPTIIKCPDNIPFYDFNLLVQHSCNEFKPKESFGLFKSERLNYFCYQDSKTTHNIIGQTEGGENFSIYTLDDLNKKVYLRINNKIQVKKFKRSL